MTIDDLAERLALSRSTIYYWVRDLPIPPVTAEAIGRAAAGTRAMQRRYTLRREAAYRQGVAEFGEFCADPSFGTSFACTSRRASSGTGTRSRSAIPSQYHADQDIGALQD